jgi:hypothetical protein
MVPSGWQLVPWAHSLPSMHICTSPPDPHLVLQADPISDMLPLNEAQHTDPAGQFVVLTHLSVA